MLILVRHGRTRWNAEGRFQGWADVALDAEGRDQSGRAVAPLRALLAPPGAPLTIVSSDLGRASETARILADGLGEDHPVERLVEQGLREVDVGRWEGLTSEEVRERFPDEHRRWAAGEDVRRGGGERLSEAGARVAGCIEALAASTGGPLIVVGHGMSLRAAVDLLAARGRIRLSAPAPHLGNAEFLVLADWRHDQTERVLSEG